MAQKGPRCPECKKAMPSVQGYQQAVQSGDRMVPVVVVYCLNCGRILGVASPRP